jgi:hypothetical protein
MGCEKPGRSPKGFVVAPVRSAAQRGSGPYPIRPSATFANFVGEGAGAGFICATLAFNLNRRCFVVASLIALG